MFSALKPPTLASRLFAITVFAIVLPAATIGWLGYSAERDAIRQAKIHDVGLVADLRHDQLVRALSRTRFRAEQFLAVQAKQCIQTATHAPTADLCLQSALSSFVRSERATGALLRRAGTDDVLAGMPAEGEVASWKLEAGQLAFFPPARKQSERVYHLPVTDRDTGMQLVVTYSVAALQDIFSPPRVLGDSGETFLADREGFFITAPRYDSEQGHGVPISAVPMQHCLEGHDMEMLELDYRAVPIIHGFRYIPEIGGGCIMAHFDQAEAFAPLRGLLWQLLLTILACLAAGALAALGISRHVVRPLRALSRAAQALSEADFDTQVDGSGSREIAELAGTFNEMAQRLKQTLGDLHQHRDHLEERVRERTAQLEAANALLRDQAARLRLAASVFEASGEAIVITDADNHIVDINPAFTRLTGYTLEEVAGKNPRCLSAGQTPPEEYAAMWQAICREGVWQGELWDRHKDGTFYPKWLTISTVRGEDGAIDYYIGSFINITERKLAEEQIHELAYHDRLTGLANRLSLEGRLEQALASGKRDGTQVAVLFIDLDRFKSINDSLGHHVGDGLLIEVAQRLRSCVRNSDVVARLGGDEFVVVLTELGSPDAAAMIADKIIRSLGEPYLIHGQQLSSTPSIGIAIFPADGADGDTLMKHADVAMYHAKNTGRNNAQFYDAGMNASAAERLAMENSLRRALERREFSLHYQPQIEVASGRVVGIEALVRWRHPEKGLVSPERFIPLAEDTGLIVPLGEWVLDEALRQLAAWRAEGIPGLRVAVNVSLHQLRSGNFPMIVAQALARHQLAATDLELEVTESVAMHDTRATIALLHRLRDMGVGLALDDFGTGYSSLSYLKLLPIDRLKLDRSFVMDLDNNKDDAEICAATIVMAHKLSLEVVAEGVENEAQLAYLARLGVDLVQGYFFSPPLPATEMPAFWRAQGTVPAYDL